MSCARCNQVKGDRPQGYLVATLTGTGSLRREQIGYPCSVHGFTSRAHQNLASLHDRQYSAGLAPDQKGLQMPEPAHVILIKNGIEQWNGRRVTHPFMPDFSGPSSGPPLLHGVNLKGANLGGADFSNSPQMGVDFRDSNLSGANFNGAMLAGARFHRANLANATFAGADLTAFDSPINTGLRPQLAPADLTDAVLTGANFSTANLAGVALGGSKPWESILFPDSTVPEQYDHSTNQVDSIADLMQLVAFLKQAYDARDAPEEVLLYFRGESKWRDGDREWVLSPSAMRDGFAQFESAMLVDLIAAHPAEFAEATSALSKWVLAQHHLLRTRFLDITKNPLVGLFFACEKNVAHAGKLHIFAVPASMVKLFNSDTVSIIANVARLPRADQDMLLGKTAVSSVGRRQDYRSVMGKLYQLIEEEKPGFEKRIDPTDFFGVFVIEPQLSSPRVRAQSGAMLASAFHERFERRVVEDVANIRVYGHYAITVPPGSTKLRFMDDLRMLQITRPNLFPGLDETSKEITDRYGHKRQSGSELEM